MQDTQEILTDFSISHVHARATRLESRVDRLEGAAHLVLILLGSYVLIQVCALIDRRLNKKPAASRDEEQPARRDLKLKWRSAEAGRE